MLAPRRCRSGMAVRRLPNGCDKLGVIVLIHSPGSICISPTATISAVDRISVLRTDRWSALVMPDQPVERRSIKSIGGRWSPITILAAPKPSPTVRVAICKREVGAKVVLFAGNRGPPVLTTGLLDSHNERGAVTGLSSILPFTVSIRSVSCCATLVDNVDHVAERKPRQ
jgi:hypothetical protein